jgi:alpha-L-glutamate ligase-like protein
MALTLAARLRQIRKEVLGLNRRNHEHGIASNPATLVALVDNKLATKETLARHDIPTPATFATFTSLGELSGLEQALEGRESFALKPTRGAGGEGILLIVRRDGPRYYKASGEALLLRDLRNHAAEILAGAYALDQSRDSVLIEQRLSLHPAFEPFSFRGIPDVRVLVARGVPILAMLRLPTRQSDGRANLHLGGVGVGVHLASGQAVYAIWREQIVRAHPDTGSPLVRLLVPEWPRILHIAAACHDAVPLGYFGVDVVVDPELGPCVLELNARPGLAIQLANHLGLRPILDALSARAANLPRATADRVALGIELYEWASRRS